MDAVTYVREKGRMYESNSICIKCPAHMTKYGYDEDATTEEIEELVSIIEKWSKENPITTTRDELSRTLVESFVLDNRIYHRNVYYDNDGNLMVSREWLNA